MEKTILSTADVARLFRVTETTVKRWADEGVLRCQKTPGGHRKFEIRNVVEFAERNNFDPVATLDLPGADPRAEGISVAILQRDFPKLVDGFVQRALSADRNDLVQYLLFLYEHKFALWEIYDLVVRPGMEQIGARWASGELDISHEHHASSETLDALARLQSLVYVKPEVGKTALFACPDGEMHDIGLKTAAYLFESEGWRVHTLGSRVPVESIRRALDELRPHALCLSVTVVGDEGAPARDLEECASAVRALGGKLIVGGRATLSPTFDRRIADAVIASARDLQEFIQAEERGGKSGGRSGVHGRRRQ